MAMRDPIAVRLAEIRVREKLTMKAMAARMGVDPGQLHRSLYGTKGVGRKLLDGAIRAFPEVAEVYAHALLFGHENLAQRQHLTPSDVDFKQEVPELAEAG